MKALDTIENTAQDDRTREVPGSFFYADMQEAGGYRSLEKQVIGELAAIGLTRATDVLRMDDHGLQIKQGEELPPDSAAAIASVEKTSGGWKIKFYDKLKALELLGEHFGFFGSQSAGMKPPENNLLEAILSSTREEMDTSDIQELQ